MWKKLFICCLANLSAAALFANIQNNPDENTLWQFLSINSAQWQGRGVQVTNASDGQGFSLLNDKSSTKAPHSIRRKVPLNKEYPYLVFETTSIMPFRGYRSWSVTLRELQNGFGSISNGEPGIVAVNCFENPAKMPKDSATLLFYFFDFKTDFKYAKMVKKPDNYITVTGAGISGKKAVHPGDKVKFTVHLKESAEEVTLKCIYKSWLYTIKVNGQEIIELKPEDEDQKIWSAEFPVNSMACTKGKTFKKGQILLRAVVLGGQVKVPIWGVMPYSFNGKK